jgi:hypothetical protein
MYPWELTNQAMKERVCAALWLTQPVHEVPEVR